MTHDFQESLEFSHSASDYPFWVECYRKAFPSMVACPDHRHDGDHQRQGIDRSIVLSNGKTYWIDEKVRKKFYTNQSPDGDIALEEWSNFERQVPGWVVKQIMADYIAYAILPISTCFLLPVVQLQSAWQKHSVEWKAKFYKCPAPNDGYTTISWAIPINVLFAAIGNCLRIKW